MTGKLPKVAAVVCPFETFLSCFLPRECIFLPHTRSLPREEEKARKSYEEVTVWQNWQTD